MDTILKNGKIYVEKGHYVSALLIRDGVIAAIGTDEEIAKLSPEGSVTDLGGKTVIPGLIDSHLHMYNTGVTLRSAPLYGASSIAECLERTRRFMDETKPAEGTIVLGRGWNHDYFQDEHRMLHASDLDSVSTKHPMIFTRACGHTLTANSLAMEMAGVTADTPQPEGGEFEVDENGNPNGVFKDSAMDYIKKLIAMPDVEEIKEILRSAMAHATENGITTVQTNDMSEENYHLVWQAYEDLAKSGEAPVRVYQQCVFSTPEGYEKFIGEGFKTGFGDDMNKIGPLKLFIDGSLGARTALMRNDYNDQPGTKGLLCIPEDLLDKFMEISKKNDMQIVIHSIGDGGIERVLNGYEKMMPDGKNPMRCGIVHCQITDMPMLERFAKGNICALIQPIFIHYDMHIADDRVGKELASTSYAFGTMDKMGIHNSYGTDSPVEDLNTMNNIYCAVTRCDLTGYPEGGWHPCEKVDVETAIDHYTINGAYNSFEENRKGRLLPGFMADMAILSDDIFTCDHEKIKDIKVLRTIMNGKTVYEAK